MNEYRTFKLEIARLQKRLDEIKALCQRHAHPGCNTGAHALAEKIVRMIEQQREQEAEREFSTEAHE